MEYINLPDYKALATLKAVVELGSVNRAAKALCVGQPAVTKRLRSLDACYGVPLMRHQGRRLRLTTAGKRVYAYAQLIMEHQASLLDDLASLRTGHNRLKLEVTFAIGEHMLPDILLHFAEVQPELRIESRLGYSRRINTRLATGLADIALLEQQPQHANIKSEAWMEDELLLVCGPSHPLWGAQSIPLEHLNELLFVLRESQSSIRNTLDQRLTEIGIKPLQTAMEVGSSDTIIELLQRGRHVSFLPQFAVQTYLERNSLHHIKIDELVIKRTLWIAYNKDSMHSQVADTFIQTLKQIAPGDPHQAAQTPP